MTETSDVLALDRALDRSDATTQPASTRAEQARLAALDFLRSHRERIRREGTRPERANAGS